MNDIILASGATSQSIDMFLRDPSTNGPYTGLAGTSLWLCYSRIKADPVNAQGAVLAAKDTAFSSPGGLGVFEKSAALQPGVYRIDWPDAAFAAGSDSVVLIVRDAATAGNVLATIKVSLRTNAANVTQIAGQAASAAAPVAFPAAVGTSTFAGGAVTLAADQAVNVTKWGGAAVGGMPNVIAPDSKADIATSVWASQSRTLTSGGGGATAAQVREEMDANSTKLARLDVAVSSRQIGQGVGGTAHTYTVLDGDGLPVVDALVTATSDAAGLVPLASGRTDAQGEVTFNLPSGTVYMWPYKPGVTFTVPDVEVVP